MERVPGIKHRASDAPGRLLLATLSRWDFPAPNTAIRWDCVRRNFLWIDAKITAFGDDHDG